jgi:hypothetical protein
MVLVAWQQLLVHMYKWAGADMAINEARGIP